MVESGRRAKREERAKVCVCKQALSELSQLSVPLMAFHDHKRCALACSQQLPKEYLRLRFQHAISRPAEQGIKRSKYERSSSIEPRKSLETVDFGGERWRGEEFVEQYYERKKPVKYHFLHVVRSSKAATST
jgi:hypothetical protein